MLTLSRVGVILGVLGAVITQFAATLSTAGHITAGTIAAALLAVWLHEEHSTDRAETAAVTALSVARTAATPAPPPSAPLTYTGPPTSPEEALAMAQMAASALGSLAGGAPVVAEWRPPPA